jgi:hypothetical protein
VCGDRRPQSGVERVSHGVARSARNHGRGADKKDVPENRATLRVMLLDGLPRRQVKKKSPPRIGSSLAGAEHVAVSRHELEVRHHATLLADGPLAPRISACCAALHQHDTAA